MFTSMTSTIHTNCISFSGCNQDVPNFTIENEQQISRVSFYTYLVWISFNEILADVYFSYSNSKWAIQKQSKCKLNSTWARKWNPPPPPRGFLQTCIISKLHPWVFEKCMFTLDWLVGVAVQHSFPQQRVTGYSHQDVS